MFSFLLFRATWFCVPEGGKKIEGFPVSAELDSLLTARYEETRTWINGGGAGGPSTTNSDETIVEKIVSLTGDEDEMCTKTNLPAAIDPYFLVFRQHSHDYARLCIERPHLAKSSSSASNTPTTTTITTMTTSNEGLTLTTTESSMTTTTTTTTTTDVSPKQKSRSPSPAQSPKLLLDSRTCESARLYRTYASFFHAVAGSSTVKTNKTSSYSSSTAATASSSAHNTFPSASTSIVKPVNVQTQMQSNSDPHGEADKHTSKTANPVNKSSKPASSATSQSTTRPGKPKLY